MTGPFSPGASGTTEPGAIVFLDAMPTGLTDDQVWNVLNGRGPDEDDDSLVAAAMVHEGAMIAMIPRVEDLQRFALLDGESLDQMHITAYFLGKADEIDYDVRAQLVTFMRDIAETFPPTQASVFSLNVFNPTGEEPCLVAGVGGEEIATLRTAIVDAIAEAGLDEITQHEPWIPHITLIYTDTPREFITEELESAMGPIIIDRIRVAFGGEVTDITLGEDTLTAADAFHLAGKHDQRTHGHGGAAPLDHTSSKDIKKSKKDFAKKSAGAATGEWDVYGSAPLSSQNVSTGAAPHPGEVALATGYVGTPAHADVNGGLRAAHGNLDDVRLASEHSGRFRDSNELRDTIGQIDDGMENSVLSQDVIAHRLVSNPESAFGGRVVRGRDNSGVAWRDHGFSSVTSGNSDSLHFQMTRLRGGFDAPAAKEPVMQMRVFIPKGTHAMGGRQYERELVIDRGTGFRIVNDHGVNNENVWHVDVEVVD